MARDEDEVGLLIWADRYSWFDVDTLGRRARRRAGIARPRLTSVA